MNFIPQQRGEFSVPPIQIYSTYPLGLVRAWTYIYLTESYWIAPEAKPLKHQSQNYSNTGEPDLDEFKELRTLNQVIHCKAFLGNRLRVDKDYCQTIR